MCYLRKLARALVEGERLDAQGVEAEGYRELAGRWRERRMGVVGCLWIVGLGERGR